MVADLARAREALQAIPPDLPRDDWVKAGMAAHAAGLDFDDFNDWSASAPNYDLRAARDTWRSFKPGKGIGAGTLFSLAKQYGHKPADRPRNGHTTLNRGKPARESVDALWARFEPATAAHRYIVGKGAEGVPLDGLRVVPADDPLTIAGNKMAGALVVPAYGQNGLQSLQFIPPAGPKMNAPGAPMAGASFTVGELDAGVVYVVEGIGQAWACWKATGRPAIACFGWGNVGKVARGLNRDGLVVVCDVGKEADAERIAQEIDAAVVRLPEGEAPNFDVNDFAQRDGFDALEVLLSTATKPEPPPPLLKPLSVVDVITNPAPPPRWVWDGYLPRGVVALLGAHGGTGKSTVALMLCVCSVTGRPLFGVPVERGPALFVSLEDSEGVVRHRVANICRAWNIDPRTLEGLHIVDGTANPELFVSQGREPGTVTPTYEALRELVQEGKFSLVVVDNASDGFAGDEIQRVQVRAFIRALASIAATNDAAVLLLAHVDKLTSRARQAQGGEGYSGSTAWHNSVRGRLFVSRAEDGTLTLEHQKSNLGRLRDPLTLTWPDGGLPECVAVDPFAQRLQARADDATAAKLLGLIAEYEGRQQYASPAPQARNNVHALLRSDPAFQSLKLNADGTRRLVNQAQRAGWLAISEYRSADRKSRERWVVTEQGREFAGIAAAPCAPTAPTSNDGAPDAQSSVGAPCAPTSVGGMGDRARTHVGASAGESEASEAKP